MADAALKDYWKNPQSNRESYAKTWQVHDTRPGSSLARVGETTLLQLYVTQASERVRPDQGLLQEELSKRPWVDECIVFCQRPLCRDRNW